MAERARAGVNVHFLQDVLGCDSVHGRAIKFMKRAGVAVEILRFVHFPRIKEASTVGETRKQCPIVRPKLTVKVRAEDFLLYYLARRF